MVHSFRAAVAEARRHDDLYFAALLSQDRILNAFGAARRLWQGWVYTPAVTVWVFLSQCLSPDHSCRDAVSRLIAWRVARGQEPCSAETGAYCTARNDLPEEVLHELVRDTGKQIEGESPESWLWHGRKVRVVDGSTITMPDTPANQAAYPQQQSQKPGCGFPIVRILVVFSLSVGVVLEAAIGKYKGKQTGENRMFRGLTHGQLIVAGSIVATRCSEVSPFGPAADGLHLAADGLLSSEQAADGEAPGDAALGEPCSAGRRTTRLPPTSTASASANCCRCWRNSPTSIRSSAA